MVNAIEHGNLGLGYEEKKQLLEDNLWAEEISKRQSGDSYKNLEVTVNFERSNDCVKITITDKGNGFNWKDFMEISVSRVTAPNGRGIAFAQRAEGVRLEYNETGNVVCLFIDF